jgi:hypothetical protein
MSRRFPRPGPSATIRLAAAALLAMLGGCATIEPGRTGGRSLLLERREEPVGLAIWAVETDGTIRYSGGRDAILGRDTWTGTLSDSEVSAFVSLLEDLPRTLEDAADAGGDPADATASVRIRVELRGPDGRRRFSVAGDPAALGPLLAWLQEASRPRLDPVLERLPRPTEPAR